MRSATELLIKYRSFVGIVLLLAVLWLAQPTPTSIFIGFFIMMVGMFFRGWSSGYINKDIDLATEGPYQLTRNPLYFGNLILGTGLVVCSNNRWATLIFALYFLFFFTFLIAIERRRMRHRFGARYDAWAREANLFFPRFRKIKGSNFNISYYMKNREYRVFCFSLLVVAALIIKYLMHIYHR